MRGDAVWILLLVGWFAGRALEGSGRGCGGPPAPSRGTRAFAPDPRSASPRELRRLPGIGETRALAVARARWEHPDDGPPLLLSDVPGIGEASEVAIRRWLERAGGGSAGSGRATSAVHSLHSNPP